jgi:hypothetical protein
MPLISIREISGSNLDRENNYLFCNIFFFVLSRSKRMSDWKFKCGSLSLLFTFFSQVISRCRAIVRCYVACVVDSVVE